nr:MAG TPA: portal protein [Caudoviricetes sp.]
MDEENLTQIWKQYSQIKQYLTGKNYYEQLEMNYNFAKGDQWENLKSGGMPMPVDNIITPVCNYKIGVISQNNMTITFTNENFRKEDLEELEDGTNFRKIADEVIEKINKNINRFFEANNLENNTWDYDEENCISGNVGMYIYEDEENIKKADMIYGNNIFFSDENNNDIQDQSFILITFRRPVEKIREEAKKHGLTAEKISQIVADNNTNEQVGNKDEVRDEQGKALCILKLYKKAKEPTRIQEKTVINGNGEPETIQEEIKEKKVTVHMMKSTKNVIYVPETDLGLTLYPVALNTWINEKNSIRGRGEPQDKIVNQIEINKTMARRDIAIALTAYPKAAYNSNMIENPNALDKVGVAIEVKDRSVQNVKNAIDYLQPAQVSPDAKNFCDELSQKTKDNASASDSALGNINPEKASGRSIIAVRDAAAVPINVHVARKKKFYEDIGRILFDFMQNVDVDGQQVIISNVDEETGLSNTNVEQIPYEIMQKLKVGVKVNVSQTDPFSILAMEEMWDSLFERQAITFEEWVSGLTNNSKYNKSKLEEIIKKRKEKEKEMALIQQQITEQQSQISGMLQDKNNQEIANIASDIDTQQNQLLGGQ